MMLNVMGIGSMAAAVVGFIHFDFILMLSVQTTITVLRTLNSTGSRLKLLKVLSLSIWQV
ncbi:hypothetical protein EfmAA96_14610 [Enterococcus faecium]|nr:hypothetical protein EfmAA96_14610 [Enterococcus faecium]